MKWTQRHVAKMLNKALSHETEEVKPNLWVVTSGTSDQKYLVEVLSDGQALCTCKWGTKGDTAPLNKRQPVVCSHVTKVLNQIVTDEGYTATIRTGNAASVKHLHRKIRTQEGVTVTQRKAG